MKIRLARIQDIDEIVTIDSASNLTHWSRDGYLECLSNKTQSIYLLESSNKKIIGVIVLSVTYEEAEILQFCIRSEYQKKGYGRLLLRRTIEILKLTRQIQQIFLEVRDGNTVAINLYNSCGFKIVGKRHNYYKVDNWRFDAIVMMLEINK